MKHTLLLLTLFCLLLVSGCGTFGTPETRYTYKTVGGRELALEVDYPPAWRASDKRPGIVFFCGGGWSVSDINSRKSVSEYFAKRGLVCVRADFRVMPEVLPDKCVADAISAMRWIRDHAAQLGLDPNRIATTGASSGGHIAACTFFSEGLDDPADDLSVSPKPNAMILFNPALDLVDERRIAGPDYMAGLADATLRQISPAYHISRETPPTLIIDGTTDVFYPQIVDFVAKCKAVGAPVEAGYTEGQPHGFFLNPPWLEKTTQEADDFLCRIGYLEKEPRVPLPTR